MRRKAVTLSELLIGIAVMAILAGAMSLNQGTFGRTTAKREADRVAGYIQAKLLDSDRTHDGLWFTVDEHKISVLRGRNTTKAINKDQPLEANTDCSFTTIKLRYRTDPPSLHRERSYKEISADSSAKVVQGTLPGYRITVKGADGNTCDVVIGSN